MHSWGHSFYTWLQPWQDKSRLSEKKHVHIIKYGHIPPNLYLAIEAYYECNLTKGKKTLTYLQILRMRPA